MSQPSVIVIDAGTMGTGIAQVALVSGHRVFLVDTSTDQTDRARDDITRRLSSRTPEVAEQIDVRLSTHADLDEVAALSAERRPEAPLVIEAVVENLVVKQEILAQAQRLFGGGAVLATNEVGDVPGLVTARVAAMLVNEASEIVRLGPCSAEDADLAMTLGTNYPIGLLARRDRWTARYAQTLIDTLADQYRSPRYRTSLTVRQAALSENGTS